MDNYGLPPDGHQQRTVPEGVRSALRGVEGQGLEAGVLYPGQQAPGRGSGEGPSRCSEGISAGKVRFVIIGEPASKANSRQIVLIAGRPKVIKSEKARNYERDALLQIPAVAKVMFTGPLRVTIRIWYATERPDLDESVILDVLQAKTEGTGKDRKILRRGVYLNDRQVREKHVFHAIDRIQPRAEIEVESIIEQGSLL